MSQDDRGMIVHRTRGGRHYRLDAARYAVLRAEAAAPPRLQRPRGVIMPAVLAALTIYVQFRLGGSGLELSDALQARHGLSHESLSGGWSRLLTHLFVHGDGGAMALNLAALLLFGINLGWRRGWVVVVTAWLGGGVVGGLVGLAAGAIAGSPLFLGSGTAVWGVIAASILTGARFHEGHGWMPWNVILGYIFVVLFGVFATGLFSASPASMAPYFAGFVSGLVAAVVVVDQRHRNEFRFSAIFYLLGMVFFVRTMERIAAMIQGVEGAFSLGVWPVLAFDLFLVAVGSVYVLIQGEVVGDLKGIALHERLDELAADAGERHDPWARTS